MAHLIDKDALVAEIESLTDNSKYCDAYECGFRDGNNSAIDTLKGKLNTLEVKEVDFERYYNEYFKGWSDYQGIDGSVTNRVGCCVTLDDIKDACRYFFELGLKAKQG